jgi:phosphoribosylanthranilate isomerase
MKAFQIQDDFDFKQLENYVSVVDYFLFDSPTENYGGSGKTFTWQLLKNYNYNIPFFLSGGINEEHIEDIQQLNIPQLVAIDINSKFETEPGLKNTEQVKQFILKLNS